MDITSVDYLVKRADFSQGKVVSSAVSLGEGDILVKVEYFALTANNLTYALTADRVGYWDFFPAPPGWGRIPVWGLGQVLQSRNNEIDPGEYLYGYFPMSTHIAMHPSKIRGDSLQDASRHRMHLSPAYNYYLRVPVSEYAARDWREIALLRPLFFASYLVHDLLSERISDVDTIIVTSASSKTAIGLAHLLGVSGYSRQRVVGLTSEQNLDFVRSVGAFDGVYPYDTGDLNGLGLTVIADFSGNSSLISRFHQHLNDCLKLCCLVGYTHRDGSSLEIDNDTKNLRFFAPDRIQKRVRDWGAAQFSRRYDVALQDYIVFARNWLRIVETFGASNVADLFGRVARNQVPPNVGHIATLYPWHG